MFRKKTSKNLFTVINPKDRTHSLDNGVRIAIKKNKLDPTKQYVIALPPNRDANLCASYSKIYYPIISDESLKESELLPTESIMRYLAYQYHDRDEKIAVDFIEVSPNNLKQANNCHFTITKLSPSYGDELIFEKDNLRKYIQSVLNNTYALNKGQLI